MSQIHIPEKLEKRLEAAAQGINFSKSSFVMKALQRHIEDTEDYLIAVAADEKMGDEKPIPLEQIAEELGISLDGKK